jgi:hypothetical protein
MDFLLKYKDYISEGSNFNFTPQQIQESYKIFESQNFNEHLFEYWWNTVFDFAALIPGVGSFFEGINLLSYAKQGEYLLAGLCAIGLIPIFGQYIGAGGSLLVKALKGGGGTALKILGPVGELVAKYFPKIEKFMKGSSFLSKFKGIAPYTDKMLIALKEFSLGKKTGSLAKIAASRNRYKSMTKMGSWLVPGDKGENTISSMDPRIASTAEENWEDFLKAVPVQAG